MNVKLVFFSFIFLFFLTTARAQHKQDSLLHLLISTHSKPDSNRVITLCELAFTYSNMDSVIFYGQKAKLLSEKLDFDKGKGRAFWLLGMANYYIENIDSAEFYLAQALIYSQRANDALALGRIYNSSANIANYLGNPGYAIELYFRSLEFKERLNDSFEEAITLNNIANLFYQQQDYVKAKEYYTRSYSKRKDASGLSSGLMLHADMADNFVKLKMLDSARHYLLAGRRLSSASEDFLGITDIYGAEVNYQNALGNSDSAIYYAKLGLDIAIQSGSEDRETLFRITLAKHYNEKKDFEIGYAFADDACKLSRKLGRINYLKEATLQRSIGLEGLGKIDQSFQLFKFYKVLSDCTMNNQIRNTVLAKDYEYQLEKASLIEENKRIELQSKLSQEKEFTAFAFISLIVVSVFSFFLYRNFKLKKKSNEELLKKQSDIIKMNQEIASQNKRLSAQKLEIQSINESLEETIVERTLEIQESVKTLTLQNQNLEQFSFIVSHNLRAPVARLKGLASLIHYDLDKEELKKITQMIKSASLDLDVVLSDLTHIIDIKSRPLENREYIDMTDLFNSIIDLMREDIETINAKVEIEVQEANQILSIKPYIRSVFTNLLSNAIKYRSHNRALVIQIQGHAVDGFHVFKVIDNGLGIDLHDGNKSKIFGLYQRFHNDIEGRGLGLYLVKTQLESLGGDISVESNPQGGTSFTICLPIN
jgi:signal transduction histidine kinase